MTTTRTPYEVVLHFSDSTSTVRKFTNAAQARGWAKEMRSIAPTMEVKRRLRDGSWKAVSM